MSTNAPSKIIQNGIVFHYDTINGKSYKGEPTVNVVTNAYTMAGWSDYGFGNDGTFITEFGTTGYRMINRPAWNGVYRGLTLNSTGNHTFSAYIRYWGGAAATNGGAVYTSGFGLSDQAVAANKSLVGIWQRVTMTINATSTSGTFYLISWGGTYGGSEKSTWDVTMPQVEQKSYASQFTDGTRSNTNGLVDLTGNCTVNLNSSSFDSSANITFNGSSCVTVDDTAAIALSGDKSFCMWINLASDSGGCGFGGKSNGTVSGMSLGYGWNSNGFMSLNWNSSNSPYLAKDLTRDVGKWVYLAAVQSGGTRYIYAMDASGIRSSSASGGTHSWSNSLPLKIGRINDHTAMPSGTKIDYVSVYNRALTQDEVLQNFNRTKSRFGM